ncbi:MAG: LacI family DNA-binding transcriptional regulator [Pseudomonadota bacterium]
MTDTKIKTMEELASVSGLSRPTLSKYFFDPTSVRTSTRERIEEALERYDYRPNIYAINQNRRLTKTIPIIVPLLADPFFGEMARKIERLCVAAGYRPLLFSAHGEQGLEVEILDSVLAMKPAGALLAPLGRQSDYDALARFCDEVPTILFDSNVDGLGEAFVGSNNDQSIAKIVDYLSETGDPPCFFELKSPPNPNAIKRRTAYEKAMRARGFQPQLVQVYGEGWDFENIGCSEGVAAFESGAFPTKTILCSNDRLAIGLLAAAHQVGISVGRGSEQEWRVAGHDDHPFSRFTTPALTTVSQDYDAIATHSMKTLVGLIGDDLPNHVRQTITFDGRLVIRASA